jgi:uncharacterized coiled-coil protein SlyX
MENPGRNMGSANKEKNKIKKSSKNKERLTIMIFKKVGKVRTFKISPGVGMLAFLFLLIYIAGTIFFTNAFFNLYRINKIQTHEISELNKKLAKKTKSLEKSKQHIALLNDYIKDEKEQSPETAASKDYTESSMPKLVDIEDLKVKRDRANISTDFKIVNKQSEDEPIGGYLFVVASIKDTKGTEASSYPSSLFKDGQPVNYKKGLRFFIQRFKSISITFTLSKSIDKPLILEILVYDRDGKLILKKVVEV